MADPTKPTPTQPNEPIDIADAAPELERLFGELFGAGFGMTATATAASRDRGADRTAPITLTVREARDGARKTLTFARRVRCTSCNGSGRDQASPVCDGCAGKRRVTSEQGTTPVQFTSACAKCKGRGHDERYDCGSCDGGLVEENEEIRINVPAGVEGNLRLHVPGKGDDAPNVGGKPGDFFAQVVVIVDPEEEEARERANASPYRGPNAETAITATTTRGDKNPKRPFVLRLHPIVAGIAAAGAIAYAMISCDGFM